MKKLTKKEKKEQPPNQSHDSTSPQTTNATKAKPIVSMYFSEGQSQDIELITRSLKKELEKRSNNPAVTIQGSEPIVTPSSFNQRSNTSSPSRARPEPPSPTIQIRGLPQTSSKKQLPISSTPPSSATSTPVLAPAIKVAPPTLSIPTAKKGGACSQPSSPINSPPSSPTGQNPLLRQAGHKTLFDLTQDVPLPSNPLPILHPEVVVTKGPKRANILNEILNTERDFVADLKILVNIFLKPMRAKQILDNQQITNLFSNVETILGLNSQLLTSLEEKLKAASKPEEAVVGEVFKKMADFLKMYSQYCANQPKAIETLEECKRKSAFTEFVEECQTNPMVRGLNIFSFIIKPIQRICKYPLFFRDLLNNTPIDHPDYTHVSDALKKIEDVVDHVNEMKRQAEDMQKVVDIQDSIEGVKDLVEPTRTYLNQAEVMIMYSNHESTSHVGEHKHLSPGHSFLFNDLVLVCKQKKKQYELKGRLPLAETKIVVLSDSESVKNAFELKYQSYSCLLSFPTEAEMQAWSRQIKMIIKRFQQKIISGKTESPQNRSSQGLSVLSDSVDRKNYSSRNSMMRN